MMKRYFMMFSAAVAALVSCHKEPNQEPAPQPQVESHEVTIEAGILSKTVLDGDAVMWEGSDEIALVFTHTSSAPHVNRTFVNQETEQTTARALFKGQLPNNVSLENGYNDRGYAVYPKTALTDDGKFSHNLPATQVAKANGSFPSGCNLSSAALALSDMGEGGSTKTDFRNALSVLRVALSTDVESVTVTGTAPLAGTAPLQMYYNSADEKDVDNGRLLVDAKGTWSGASTSVTLTPADGTAFENKTYNILVWPGKQEGLTITLNFKNLGEYEKASSISTSKPVTFKPAKFYNLNVKNTEELVVEEITGKLDELEESLPSVDDLENKVDALLSQIQSVSLMTEYLDNAVYARYAQMTYSKQKLDLTLDYIVRPESAVDGLIEAFNADPSVVSAVYGYTTEDGFELQNGQLAVNALAAKELPGIGRIVTASVAASWIDDKFYEGQFGASVALQIAAGNSSILSDFAHLVPKSGSAFSGSYLENITAVPGAEIVIPFSFATSSDEFTIAVTGKENVTSARVTYNATSRTGNLFVGISDSVPIESQTVTLTLTAGDETISNTFTFVDNGARINLSSDGDVDWIGGEVKVTAETTNLGSGGNFSTNGAGLSYVNGIFAFDENTGGERTATVTYEVSLGSLRFNKSISLTQKAYGTPLSREYYSDGQWVQFQSHNTAYTPINLVIMGDGFLKKDLTPGGRFERAARSAMNAFFSIEPAMTYKERFSVHMMTYASQHEGPRLTTIDDAVHETAFETWYNGPDNTYVNMEDNEYGRQKVVNLVRSKFGEYGYYRTVVIMLVNSSANLGSTVYPTQTTISTSLVGDGYASFAIAMVGAYSSGMSSLVRHEGVGHGLGRLADEYLNNEVSAEDAINTLTTEHARGYYLNVSSASGISGSPWADLAGYGDTGYWLGAWKNASVIYRPSETSIMRDSQKMYFNAVSRRIIFRRIILQTEGSGYTDQINTMFKEYDVKNL